MIERWLPVVGYEGYYEVSDLGNVRSIDRVLPRRGQSPAFYPGRLLAPADRKWQLQVGLQRDGRWRGLSIHRLVLEAFVGPCPPGMECCHNDGNYRNNRVENLRWDTHAANMADKRSHGTDWWSNRTHCKNGHLFDESNTIISATNGRICRQCRKRINRERHLRLKERQVS